MTLLLEKRKLKHTGYVPAFICGGLLAAAVPIVQMAVRSEVFTAQSGNPLEILLDGNWQMMSMLNVLLAVCGACIMYHTEYADNAIQKLDMLPIFPSQIFFEKFFVSVIASLIGIIFESASLMFCVCHWFSPSALESALLIKNMGYEMVLMLPAIMLTLLISSLCRNMWISLGLGVILVFTASMISTTQTYLSLFPFSLPYQMLHLSDGRHVTLCLLTAIIETILFGGAEMVCLKIRRCFA